MGKIRRCPGRGITGPEKGSAGLLIEYSSMSLPSDFVIEDAVGSIGDLIIYRADHPIHGKVSVYLPDENLPPKLAGTVRSRLYQSGLRMRQISLLNLRFVAKALEVSQNPNEPYVITQHAKYSLEELIGNGVTIKTKRMFVILAQVLEATVSLAANGWAISRIQARQIKMPQVNAGDVSLAIIEDAEQSIGANEVEAVAACARQKVLQTTRLSSKPLPLPRVATVCRHSWSLPRRISQTAALIIL
jgi:hypothetical protein